MVVDGQINILLYPILLYAVRGVSGARFLRVVGVTCLSKGHIVQTPRDALSKGKRSGALRSGTHRKKTLLVYGGYAELTNPRIRVELRR
jgi:hypothetical protein